MGGKHYDGCSGSGVGGHGLDRSGSGYVQVAGTCKYLMKLFGFHKMRGIF